MATKLTKTGTPGIYRRHKQACEREGRCDCPYVVVSDGKALTFRTLTEAKEGKELARRGKKLSRAHASGLHRDEPKDDCPDCRRERAERELEDPPLHAYALGWVERYHGTGRRGFREETRDEYRGLLLKYALEFFPPDTRLGSVRPSRIAEFIAWLVKQPNGRVICHSCRRTYPASKACPGCGGNERVVCTLSDKSVRNALGPLRAVLASAKREGLIRENPAVGAALPYRPQIEDDEEDLPRPFPGDTMETVVSLIHPDHRVMFELLAVTGVRRSELLAFGVKHLELDGAEPRVRIRQRTRWQKRKGQVIGAVKSRHSRRELPIPLDVADRLKARVAGMVADQLVFESPFGGPYDPARLHREVLAPACAEAGVEWAGFHTFRHTVASRMFAAGRNAVQVQHWLGHHSAAFTLKTYVHLLEPGDLGGPLEPARVKKKSRSRPEISANQPDAEIAETLDLQGEG